MKFLKSLFGKQDAPVVREPFTAALDPEQDLFVVGDVHGRDDLLAKLLEKQPKGSQLVFVGDLIDRGENSANVINTVIEKCTNGAICLIGNHEKMMLDFLERPTERGGRWLRYGGLQTLHSYGVRGISERASDAELLAARDNLLDAMAAGTQKWMRDLPTQLASGNVHIVHAAANPNLGMSEQPDKTLIWGNRDFLEQTRQDGQWVVHGHTIVDHAIAADGRIAVDTGAFATGILTAALIKKGECSFITVR